MEFKTIFDYYLENKLTNVISVTVYKCGCKKELNHKELWEEYPCKETFEEEIKFTYGANFLNEYKLEIKGNTLYVYDEINDYCIECRAKRFYCDESPRPVGFEHVVKYHGLNAYYCDGEYESIINNLKTIMDHPEYEICCSTDTIGGIGIVVNGDVTMASNHDLNTGIDRETNRRYYHKSKFNDRYIIYDAKDLKDNELGNNNEIIVKNIKAEAIWLTDKATDEEVNAAFELSDLYDLDIIDVEQIF